MSAEVKTKATELIALLVVLIIVASLTPTFVDTVAAINTTAWNFTGHAAAATLLGMLPLLFIVGVVIYFMVALIKG